MDMGTEVNKNSHPRHKMIEIPLTQGKTAFIDDENFALVNQYKWRAYKNRNTHYAQANINKLDGTRTTLQMHRLIMNSKFGQETDHEDHNGLNNQKYNLRFCTGAQNQHNSKKRNRKTTSIYKGVNWDKERKKYHSRIRVNYKAIFLGRFVSEIQAAKVYNRAAIMYFGKFANLNIIRSKDGNN